MQQELFSPAVVEQKTIFIPGFRLQRDYIGEPEEAHLLSCIENGPWQSDWKRRIQQYGFGYEGGQSKLTWLRDFPDWLCSLAQRVAQDAPLERFPENCVINEYLPPQGIGPHRDYPEFGGSIACVSLGSDVVMNFANRELGRVVPVHVPRRSFWVISDEARWKWTHGIAPRLADTIAGERRARGRRVSITFRTAGQPALRWSA